MSDNVRIVLVAFISALFSLIAAILSARNGSKLRDNQNKLQEIHILMNSRLDELVMASKDSGRIAEQLSRAQENKNAS